MAKRQKDHTEFGYQPSYVAEFAVARLRGAPKPLTAHIYQPQDTAARAALIWFHAGGFRSGGITHSGHRLMARRLTKKGIITAFPEYRLGAREADLKPQVAAMLAQLDPMAHPQFPPQFRRSRALAALEDAVAFLHWFDQHRDAVDYDGQIVVGGSSAGGMTALNLAFVAPFLGMTPPKIAGVISVSGGLAFPELHKNDPLPVFAIHSPNDGKVPYQPIYDLAQAAPSVSLMSSDDQAHGDVAISPDEPKPAGVDRIGAKVLEFLQLDQP